MWAALIQAVLGTGTAVAGQYDARNTAEYNARLTNQYGRVNAAQYAVDAPYRQRTYIFIGFGLLALIAIYFLIRH